MYNYFYANWKTTSLYLLLLKTYRIDRILNGCHCISHNVIIENCDIFYLLKKYTKELYASLIKI